jgi:outer membrane assembly lipoprotein YfiO
MKNIYAQGALLLVFLGAGVHSVQAQQPEESPTIILKADNHTQDTSSSTHATPTPVVANISKENKKGAAARRKRQSLYKQKKVTMSDMTYEQLKETKNKRIQEKNLESAIKYAQKMLPLCKDMHEQQDLKIELADLLFDNGELEKAGKEYQDFAKLYPGTSKVEHATYRAILCSFYGILDSQRDQTKTKDTLDLTLAFLERAEVFNEHHDEVLAIQKQCYDRLVESEINVLNYYLQNDRFTAAQVRVDGLRKDYAPKVADLEPRLLSVEIVLAEKQGKQDIAAEKKLALQEKYPNFKEAEVLIAQVQENRFVTKF